MISLENSQGLARLQHSSLFDTMFFHFLNLFDNFLDLNGAKDIDITRKDRRLINLDEIMTRLFVLRREAFVMDG